MRRCFKSAAFFFIIFTKKRTAVWQFFWHPLRESNPHLILRRSSGGAFLTPCKSPKILDFTGVSGVSLLLNSRPKPANFSWFFAFLLAGYYRRFLHNRNTAVMLSTSKLTQRTSRTRKDFRIPKRIGRYSRMLTNR